MPPWWNGQQCDTGNYPGSYPLGASWDGLTACGPGPLQGGTDHTTHFFSGAWGEYEWECVELSMRWMYLAWGVHPYPANGDQVAANYATYKSAYNPSGPNLQYVANGTAGTAPVPGDVLSYSIVHTSVVTASSVNGSGNGSLTVIQENVGDNNGWGTLSVSNWSVSGSVTGWLHNPASSGPLTVTTTSLASGEVGIAYSATLTSSGGSGGNAWTTSSPSGSLPPGLSLQSSGVISGVPLATGTFGFSVSVTDSDGTSASAGLSITVSPNSEDTLLNGSFENNQTTGWTYLNGTGGVGSDEAYSSTDVPEGGNYLEFNTSVPGGSVYQDVATTLSPNQSYTFSTWVRAHSTKPEKVCLALFGIGSSVQNGVTCRTVGQSWQLISAPYDVSAEGLTDLRAQVYLYTTEANCDITGAELVNDTLLDGSFENNQTTGWTYLNGTGGVGSDEAYSSTDVPEGGNYLEFNTSVPGGSVYQDVATTLSPNQSYTFSTWVRAHSTKPEKVCLALFGIGSSVQNGVTCRTVGQSWQLISAPYDVSAEGLTDLRAQVYLYTTEANCDITGASFAADSPSVPTAPTQVIAAGAVGQATVSWATPGDGGSSITSYTVTATDLTRPGNGSQWVTGSGSPLTMTGLTSGDSYAFTVRAVNAVGVGPASPPSKAISIPRFTSPGRGYWLVTAKGNVYNLGDAGFYGSEAGKSLPAPVVSVASTP